MDEPQPSLAGDVAYKDIRDDLDRLVLGRRRTKAAELDSQYRTTLGNFLRSPLFFVPSATLLYGYVFNINNALSEIRERLFAPPGDETDDGVERDENGFPVVVGRDVLGVAAAGDAVTLQGAVRIDRSMKLLQDHGPRHLVLELTLLTDDPLRPVTDELVAAADAGEHLPPLDGDAEHYFRIPSLGVVPSLHLVDPAPFRHLLNRTGKTFPALSRSVFGDEFAGLVDTLVSGRPRVTKFFARDTASLLGENFKDQQGFIANDFDENNIFRLAPDAWKKETALSCRRGNRVPGFSEYLAIRD